MAGGDNVGISFAIQSQIGFRKVLTLLKKLTLFIFNSWAGKWVE
jgi:hypothetical protein